MNKLSVSIGIPAYNEQSNIVKLLHSVLSQKGDSFSLDQIAVFSDGSTDKTVEKIKEVGDARIMVIDNKDRVGQAAGQNEIIKRLTGDVILLLNADTLVGGDSFIEDAVQPFLQDAMVGMIGPRFEPVRPRTFFEKILNFSTDFKNDMFKSWNGGNNIYMCCGRARFFSKGFVKRLSWPTASSEDAYSYLACISQGYKFVYLDKPLVIYKLPDNYRDHMKQSTRFMVGPELMAKYFAVDLVMGSYAIPTGIKMASAVRYFLKNPLYFSFYVIILMLSKSKSLVNKNDASLWDVSESSKTLT